MVELGLPEARIYKGAKGSTYYIRFRGEEICTGLYHVFYDDVPDSMYLNRKFERFKVIASKFEGVRVISGMSPLAFPESWSRTRLAEILGISPAQVTAIMTSPLVVGELRQLFDKPNSDTVQRIKQLIVDKGLIISRKKAT